MNLREAFDKAHARTVANDDGLNRLLSNPEVLKRIEALGDNDSVEALLNTIELLRKENMGALRVASDYEQLISVREFEKCLFLLRRNIRQASSIREQMEKRNQEEKENLENLSQAQGRRKVPSNW